MNNIQKNNHNKQKKVFALVEHYTINFETFGEYSIAEWKSMLFSNKMSKALRQAIELKIAMLSIQAFVPFVAMMSMSNMIIDMIRKIPEK